MGSGYRGRRGVLLAAVLTWVAPATAAAQTEDASAEQAPPEDVSPEVLIDRAVDLREAGDDVGARALLGRAYDEAHTPRSARARAAVEQALGLGVASERHLGEALGATDDPWIDRYRASLEQSLARVRENIGSIPKFSARSRGSAGDRGRCARRHDAARSPRPRRRRPRRAGGRTGGLPHAPADAPDRARADGAAAGGAGAEPGGARAVVPEVPAAALSANDAPAEGGDDLLSAWWLWTIVACAVVGAGVGVAVGVLEGGGTEDPCRLLRCGRDDAGGALMRNALLALALATSTVTACSKTPRTDPPARSMELPPSAFCSTTSARARPTRRATRAPSARW